MSDFTANMFFLPEHRIGMMILTKFQLETKRSETMFHGCIRRQQAVPKPFLILIDWVKTSTGWKMASDVATPVPPPPTAGQ